MICYSMLLMFLFFFVIFFDGFSFVFFDNFVNLQHLILINNTICEFERFVISGTTETKRLINYPDHVVCETFVQDGNNKLS